MSITRTEAELQTAIETMFRVRAVESPPDEQGARTIWHRGHKGADLVTWVDAFGRVTRQELYLFDDCLIWEKTAGVRTGAAPVRENHPLEPSEESIAFDPATNDGRIVRARRALGPYSGADKFILHARELVGGEDLPVEPSPPDSPPELREPLPTPVQAKSGLDPARRTRTVAAIVICLAIAVLVLLLIELLP